MHRLDRIALGAACVAELFADATDVGVEGALGDEVVVAVGALCVVSKDVLPDNLPLRCHLKESSEKGFEDQGVAVGQPLTVRGEAGEEFISGIIYLIRPKHCHFSFIQVEMLSSNQ